MSKNSESNDYIHDSIKFCISRLEMTRRVFGIREEKAQEKIDRLKNELKERAEAMEISAPFACVGCPCIGCPDCDSCVNRFSDYQQ